MKDAPLSRPTLPATPLTTRSLKWGLLGGTLALGAPAGFWLLLVVSAPQSRESLEHWTFAYIAVSTFLVFTLFGLVMGRMIQRERENGL